MKDPCRAPSARHWSATVRSRCRAVTIAVASVVSDVLVAGAGCAWHSSRARRRGCWRRGSTADGVDAVARRRPAAAPRRRGVRVSPLRRVCRPNIE